MSLNSPAKFLIFALSVLSFTLHGNAAASIKVAFIGDQGVRSTSESVLSLIASEGTDLLLIQGDLGYDDNTANTWDSHLTNILGRDFPVLTVVGNHENFEWPLYQRLIQQRIDRIDGLSCSGNTGVKSKCKFGNIEVVQVAPAIYEVPGIDAEDDYAAYIRSSFAGSDNGWRICSWHKPHTMMQTGDKTGPSNWDIYDECLNAGAMIALAHDHAYARTYLLRDFRSQSVVHRQDEMALQSGQSFSFVSGLGGREVRRQSRGGDYFASIYTADQGATNGALFCTFEEVSASCYFKAIDGAVPDRFTLTRGSNTITIAEPELVPVPIGNIPSPSPSAGNNGGYVFSRSDKDEQRWIDLDADGQWGSVWISDECASSLGGATQTGNWEDLLNQAPGFDTIANPCVGASLPGTAALSVIESANGYVFSRTDTDEYRWIDTNSAGELGSVWIDSVCVEELGGVKRTGDWNSLIALAPGFDTIASPCY